MKTLRDWRTFAALILFALIFTSASAAEPPRGPLTIERALDEFRVVPGLKIELVASEPAIESPVAMAFDENGRLWVVEMRDYPNGPAPGGKPEGRVKVLEDRDGDGRYETSRVFADELLFANGLLPWNGGVIVTAAPHILQLSDTDGDGRADKRDVLFEGFTVGNPQLRVSHPILGLDGWIYAANGLRGGKIKKGGAPDAEAIDLSGRDFRFDPIRDRHEPIAGMGQFGNTFDDWGHRFVCTNRNHVVPIVFEEKYAKRNPYFAFPANQGDNQNAGGAAPVYPISKQFTTSSLHLGSFTAACGVMIYRGDLLPESYRGSAFTCEPTGNLVHQEVLEPDGASFRGRRAPGQEKSEFLASRDEWFRPVSLAHGPDGALYVVDMYRAVIEHPEWMPPELRNRPDLALGKDRGRIWRIAPANADASKAKPARLGSSTTAELVESLKDPNAWRRVTAQRLLMRRQGAEAIEPLKRLAESSDHPQGQVHAAWLLDRLGALNDEGVAQLLGSKHPRVREQGVILAESRLSASQPLQRRLLAMTDESDPRVRFQLALTLGMRSDPAIVGPLAGLGYVGAEDRWTRFAVASAPPRWTSALTQALLTPKPVWIVGPKPGQLRLIRELAAMVSAKRDRAELNQVLEAMTAFRGPDPVGVKVAALSGLAEGASRRGARLADLFGDDPKAVAAIRRAIAETSGLIASDQGNPETRIDAIRLLAHVPWEDAARSLNGLLAKESPRESRIAALRTLAEFPNPDADAKLLEIWMTDTPAIRREAAQALIARPNRAKAVLEAIAAGKAKPGDLDSNQTRQLLQHANPDVRRLAAQQLAASMPADRKQTLERYRTAAAKAGHLKNGREVFRKICATCHVVDGIGVAVGPDIGDTRTKTKEMLLQDILNPNAAVDGNYVSYAVVTKDGRSLSGLITEENASSLTLKRAEGQADIVLRQDIEEMRSSGISLMPEGVEKDISVEQMADLLEFLKEWRYAGTIPGR